MYEEDAEPKIERLTELLEAAVMFEEFSDLYVAVFTIAFAQATTITSTTDKKNSNKIWCFFLVIGDHLFLKINFV